MRSGWIKGILGGVGLWCSTPFSTLFQLCRGGEIFKRRKLEYPEKTNDLSQVTDKLDYIILFEVHLAISGIQTHYVRYIAIEL